MVALMAMVVCFAACSDDDDSNHNGNNGGGGKKLTKMTYLSYYKHYENGSLQHTSGYYNITGFIWSGNNLTGINWKGYNENGVLEEEPSPYTFVYNGNNLTEIRVNGSGYQENIYFTYNGAQITEMYGTWSEGSYSGWGRTTYTYSNNGQLQSATHIDDDGDNSTTYFTWSGNNVVSEQEYENGSLYRTTNYTYDSKQSVYSTFPTALKLWDGDYSWLSANNVILETQQYSDGNSYTDSYTFTYNGDYPTSCTEHSTSSYSSTSEDNTYTTYFTYSDNSGATQIPQVYYVKATENNDDWGYVNGGGAYAAGTMAAIYAYAWYGYNFQSWNDGSSQNPRTFTVNSNANYTAIFSDGGSGGGTLLSEDFDNGIPYNWTTIDADGDGYGWLSSADIMSEGYGHYSSTACAASQSYVNSVGALTPDNYLVSPAVTIPNANGYYLDWYVAAQDANYPSEYYTVYVGYMSGSTFIPYGTLYSETVEAKSKDQGTWRYRSVNLNSYKGQTVRFAFRHYNCTDMFYLLIDDVVVSNSKSAEQATTNIATPNKEQRTEMWRNNPFRLNRHNK